MIRTILERLVRQKKVKRFIEVQNRKIPIFVSPDAQLKYLKKSGSWDKDLVNLAASYINVGDEVWDIGANVGVFTFAAAAVSQTGRVLAFEPDTFLAEIIKNSIQLNELSNVYVVPIAISSNDGFSEFQVAKRGRASNCLSDAGGRSQMGGVRSTHIVPTLTCDSVGRNFNSVPKFIKIDVEGAELLVLHGLKELLLEQKPIIYIELSSETKLDAVKILQGHGYSSIGIDIERKSSGDFLFISNS